MSGLQKVSGTIRPSLSPDLIRRQTTLRLRTAWAHGLSHCVCKMINFIQHCVNRKMCTIQLSYVPQSMAHLAKHLLTVL